MLFVCACVFCMTFEQVLCVDAPETDQQSAEATCAGLSSKLYSLIKMMWACGKWQIPLHSCVRNTTDKSLKLLEMGWESSEQAQSTALNEAFTGRICSCVYVCGCACALEEEWSNTATGWWMIWLHLVLYFKIMLFFNKLVSTQICFCRYI